MLAGKQKCAVILTGQLSDQ